MLFIRNEPALQVTFSNDDRLKMFRLTMRPPKNPASQFVLIIASAVVVSLTGCSDHAPQPNFRAEQMKAEAAKPVMAAEDVFFDGKLLVEANLSRGFGSRGPGGGAGGAHSGGGGHRHGGGEGGGRRGGDGPASEGTEGGPGGGGTAVHESNLPPVALRLRLTNTSQETLEVTFTLCKSELGDFAVRPERLALTPGQSAEPDRMTSRLGLTSAELVLKVGLRVAGKTEQKDLVLKVVPPSDEPQVASKPAEKPAP